MALRLVSPAPIGDVAAMMRETGVPLSARKFAGDPLTVAMLHLKSGRSHAALDEAGQAVAAGGYIETAPGVFEGWFLCRPHAAARILTIVRLAQLTLPALGQDGAVKICARVAPGWRPGQRIAAMLGMTMAGVGMGFEIWERTE